MRINITYPKDKMKRTDEVAEFLGLSRSAFITMCVSHYIATMIDGEVREPLAEKLRIDKRFLIIVNCYDPDVVNRALENFDPDEYLENYKKMSFGAGSITGDLAKSFSSTNEVLPFPINVVIDGETLDTLIKGISFVKTVNAIDPNIFGEITDITVQVGVSEVVIYTEETAIVFYGDETEVDTTPNKVCSIIDLKNVK